MKYNTLVTSVSYVLASVMSELAQFPPNVAEGWVSNRENKDLEKPIPFSDLGISSAKDMGKVVLVHRWFSPPSAAIRALLNYYQVTQDRIIMDMPFKSSVSKSTYKLVPQLLIFSNSQNSYFQVNDSWVILKNVYTVLSGCDVTEDIGDDVAVKELACKIPLALLKDEHAREGGTTDFARHFMGAEGWLPPLKWVCYMLVKPKFEKLQQKFPETFQSKIKWFMEQIRSRSSSQFYSKASEPGPVDVFLYGYICCTMSLCSDLGKEDESWVANDLRAAGAMEWFQAVDVAYRARSDEKVVPDHAKQEVSSSFYL